MESALRGSAQNWSNSPSFFRSLRDFVKVDYVPQSLGTLEIAQTGSRSVTWMNIDQTSSNESSRLRSKSRQIRQMLPRRINVVWMYLLTRVHMPPCAMRPFSIFACVARRVRPLGGRPSVVHGARSCGQRGPGIAGEDAAPVHGLGLRARGGPSVVGGGAAGLLLCASKQTSAQRSFQRARPAIPPSCFVLFPKRGPGSFSGWSTSCCALHLTDSPPE